jgi:hypothetical protein
LSIIRVRMPSDPLQLSADDLMAPLPEVQRLGGVGPFVINLRTAHTPIDLPDPAALTAGHAFVYRVQRNEDRRVRHRLRLGPFATEDDAIAVLEAVRQQYPMALTATADGEDLRAIANLVAKTPRPSARRGAAPTKDATAPRAAAEATKTVGAAKACGAVNADQAAKVSGAAKTAGAASAAAAAKTAGAPASAVGAPKPEAARSSAAKAAAAGSAAAKPTASQGAPDKVPAVKPAAAAVKPAAPIVTAKGAEKPVLPKAAASGVRSLAPAGVPGAPLDDNAPRWYAIQLAAAEKAFDPQSVPKLDILCLYRLYSVAGLNQGRTAYALRLGFFSEESAAEAVAQYLASYYDKPTVMRVSVAERERFAIQRGLPGKESAPAGSTAYGSLLKTR